jgi:hypothetical protein
MSVEMNGTDCFFVFQLISQVGDCWRWGLSGRVSNYYSGRALSARDSNSYLKFTTIDCRLILFVFEPIFNHSDMSVASNGTDWFFLFFFFCDQIMVY